MQAAVRRSSLAVISLSGNVVEPISRTGGFDSVQYMGIKGRHASELATWIAAAELAEARGCEWMIGLRHGEALVHDALQLIQPATELFDAIFGAARIRGDQADVAGITRLAFDTEERLPHALLRWWVPDTHFVRTATAGKALGCCQSAESQAWQVAYLFEIWAQARCLKTASPLLSLDSPPQARTGVEVSYILDRLEKFPVFLPVSYGRDTYFLLYTGRNPGIEQEQSRGLFYESNELAELHKRIGPGARVVDVGANTGNHTIYFAGPMRASVVLPIEPMPDAASALRQTVERNRLTNIELSHLGFGVGQMAGRACLRQSQAGGLGSTTLSPHPDGEIMVQTLDDVISTPPDLLKIDVEGMELEVLAGARRLITQNKPLIYIEVSNANTSEFCAWLQESGYRVERIFPDKQHANYLIVPK